MTSQEPLFDNDGLNRNPWPALAWLVLAAAVSITAFLLAPLP